MSGGGDGDGTRGAAPDAAPTTAEYDDIESLRAENARLRAALRARATHDGRGHGESSDARYRGLVESSLLALCVGTVDDPARVLYANPAFKRLFGFAQDADLRGLHYLDAVLAPHERERIAAHRAARRSGLAVPDDMEIDGRRTDGTRVIVQLRVTPLEQLWDGERAVMLVFLDITSRRLAEQALRESEARFRDFAQAASDWYWETGPDLRVTYVSSRYEAITGVPVSEILGRSQRQLLAGGALDEAHDADERWTSLDQTVAARRAWRDFTFSRVARDGSVRTLSCSAVPIVAPGKAFGGYRGIGRDLTAEALVTEALERERARLLRAERTFLLGSWQWDLDAREVHWSEGIYRICGIDPSSFVLEPRTANSPYHPEDLPRVEAAMRHGARTGEPFGFRARVMRTDGTVRSVRVMAECETHADGAVRMIFGVVQDVTEHDRAEALLRDAVESIPDGFAIYDAEDRLTLFNEAYRVGVPAVSPQIAPGLRFADLLRALADARAYADPRASTPEWIEERLASHRTPGPPVERTFRDGKIMRVIERRTRDGGTLVVRVDVTEARRTEALLRDAIESMPHGLLLWDADDRLVLANDAFLRANPAGPSGIVPGVRFEDAMSARVRGGVVRVPPGEEEEYIRARLARHREPNGEPLEQEFADGRWFELRESRTRDGGVLGFSTDITARKRAERDLALYRERLEELVAERTRGLADAQGELLRAERFAAIGHLTAAISHELRNPLGTVSASAHLLSRRLAQAEGVPRILSRIDRSVDRCVSIIEELLDYTRERPLERKALPVGDWCRRFLEGVAVPAFVAVELDVQANPVVAFDPVRLGRALGGIVDNAWHAMRSTGPDAAPGGTIEVVVRGSGTGVEIVVSDGGPGIAPARLARIFEPLYSTKSFGVGLGLPRARQILRLHGGDVHVESPDGGGTRVTLTLPGLRDGGPATAPGSATGWPADEQAG